MPYIDILRRRKIHEGPDLLNRNSIETAGDMQYAIAILIKDYINRHGLNYQNCNDIMGALAGAQMEFYRKTVAPYEDKKIEENGDV